MASRIPESELEYDSDIRCFNGIPFTGIGFELFDNGELRAESEYKDGLEHNICKEWYSNGQLKQKTECKRGMKHGSSFAFFEDGEKKVESHYEWGIELDYIEWSHDGKLLVERKLDPESPESNYKILQKFRRIYGELDN